MGHWLVQDGRRCRPDRNSSSSPNGILSFWTSVRLHRRPKAWEQEIHRRLDAVEAGKSTEREAFAALAQLEARLREVR